MKKLFLTLLLLISIGIIGGINIQSTTENNKNELVIDNVVAFAEMESSCSWTGWFRSCEITNCDGNAECHRRGCICR
ncbi:MAG: hypothetical protein JXR51_01585 [Bacteroidales bacterium]|nr:hypothetical protein [Bacteroidales bacterium]